MVWYLIIVVVFYYGVYVWFEVGDVEWVGVVVVGFFCVVVDD